MPYKIQFVGLVCFFDPGKGRIALMPDGRGSAPKHTARIAIDKPKDEVKKSTGNWPNNDGQVGKGDFVLDEPCEIELSGVNTGGSLDISGHGKRLCKLTESNRKFRIDPAKAQTIARVTITNGTLKEFRYPGTDNTQDASLISELLVPHNGDIEITVKFKSETRTITLRAGTEVGIANESSDPKVDHFHIYEQLASNDQGLGTTPATKLDATKSGSTHRVFKGGPIVDGVRCPNTGCC